MTSGEITHQELLTRDDPVFAAMGRKCLHFTWSSRGAIPLDGLGLTTAGHFWPTFGP